MICPDFLWDQKIGGFSWNKQQICGSPFVENQHAMFRWFRIIQKWRLGRSRTWSWFMKVHCCFVGLFPFQMNQTGMIIQVQQPGAPTQHRSCRWRCSRRVAHGGHVTRGKWALPEPLWVEQSDSRRWFQIFFIFITIWGRFPIWLIFFKGVETTN